jgi:hypothetical protein
MLQERMKYKIYAFNKNMEEVNQEDYQALLKYHDYGNMKKFYYAKTVFGLNRGQLFNPYEGNVSEAEFINMQKRSMDEVKYVRVAENVYNLYKKFLETKNSSYYIQANREKQHA